MEAEEGQLIKKAIECMDKATACERKEDGFEIYGQYITSELRTIASSHAQGWAKLKIQNILYSAHTEPGIQPRGSAYSMPSYNRPFFPPPNVNGPESFHP